MHHSTHLFFGQCPNFSRVVSIIKLKLSRNDIYPAETPSVAPIPRTLAGIVVFVAACTAAAAAPDAVLQSRSSEGFRFLPFLVFGEQGVDDEGGLRDAAVAEVAVASLAISLGLIVHLFSLPRRLCRVQLLRAYHNSEKRAARSTRGMRAAEKLKSLIRWRRNKTLFSPLDQRFVWTIE